MDYSTIICFKKSLINMNEVKVITKSNKRLNTRKKIGAEEDSPITYGFPARISL